MLFRGDTRSLDYGSCELGLVFVGGDASQGQEPGPELKQTFPMTCKT